jgi:hypothetical protein
MQYLELVEKTMEHNPEKPQTPIRLGISLVNSRRLVIGGIGVQTKGICTTVVRNLAKPCVPKGLARVNKTSGEGE